MCGFLIHKTKQKLHPERIKKIAESLQHRGLEISIYHENNAFVIHNVLPMTTLDESIYKQPLRNRRWGTGFVGVFSGEIFNWESLKKKYDFPSDNDSQLFTEFVLSQDPIPKLHEIDGFWNFAAVNDNKLIGIVDYLNQKPLYYRTDMEAISSEPFALSLLGETTRNDLFLSTVSRFNYDITGGTAWKEIRQIPTGCYYIDGNIKPYWDWRLVQNVSLREGLFRSVEMRLKGERDIVMLLSGGLDSAIIYKIATHFIPNIKVLHIENGEENFVKLLTNNYEKLNLKNYLITKKEAIRRNQTPVDLGSVVPQAQLAEALKKKDIHVVLSGDGADELFNGYNRSKYYDSQHSDIFNELPYYHNPRLDRIMMGSIVELRAPFLASYIVKYAMELDYNLRREKKCLKTTFVDIIPDEIINRNKLALKSKDVKSKTDRENILENIKIFRNIFKL